MDLQLLGQRIKAERKAHRMTQQELAERIGVEPSNLSHIERGLSAGSVQTLIRIATVLDTSLDNLLADSIPNERHFYLASLEQELESCTSDELRVVEATVKTMVAAMKKVRNREE